MAPALQFYHDNFFVYTRNNNLSNQQFWVGPEEAAMVAQHYGLGTHLMDWTSDPLVAVVFAAHGQRPGNDREGGVVLISIERAIWPILPPTFVKRLWQQSGCFEEFQCRCFPPECRPKCEERFIPINNILRVYFTIEGTTEQDFLESEYGRLMVDDGELSNLIHWALERARGKERLRHLLSEDEVELLLLPVSPTHENVKGMIRVAAQRAVRKVNGQWALDTLALRHFQQAIGSDSFLTNYDGVGGNLMGSDRIIAETMSGPGLRNRISAMRYAAPETAARARYCAVSLSHEATST